MTTKKKQLKWCALQPLTGGMYLGAEEAIGCPADFIISFPGFNSWKLNKQGEKVGAANEVNLTEYLKKKNRMVPYYVFDRKPFDLDISIDNVVIKNPETDEEVSLDYSNMDIVVGVPVCSGLSTATMGASQEAIDLRNSNMKFLANYTLNVIKPKMYIFENAPTLFTARGNSTREILEEIAAQSGYSVLYYKTDTNLHCNCQRRKRTFVVFQKWDADCEQLPNIYDWQNAPIDAAEYLKQIPADAAQNDWKRQMDPINIELLKYLPATLGKDWRHIVHKAPIVWLRNNGKTEDFIKQLNADPDFTDEQKAHAEKNIRRFNVKLDDDKGYFFEELAWNEEGKIGSVMFRMMPCFLHPTEDRILTIRELLYLMGHPHDFEFQGGEADTPKIGQNVPVKTAKFIVEQAVNIINNWDDLKDKRETGKGNIIALDNIKQEEVPVGKMKAQKSGYVKYADRVELEEDCDCQCVVE